MNYRVCCSIKQILFKNKYLNTTKRSELNIKKMLLIWYLLIRGFKHVASICGRLDFRRLSQRIYDTCIIYR